MPITVSLKSPLKLAPAPEPEFASAFDYDSIDVAVAGEAKAAASRIRSRISGIKTSIIDIGKDLLSVKGKLAHGEFGDWLEAEFGMSDRTAQRYMSAASELGDISDTVSDLPAKVLYALAAPSTPAEVKGAVIAEIQAGKKPTPASVAAKIKAAKIASPAKKEPAGKAHDKAVKQAVALLFQHLPDKTLATFTKHCATAGWHELAAALKEAA